jgi:hypothetical protein
MIIHLKTNSIMEKQIRPIYEITNEIINDMQREYREARKKHVETGKGKLPRLPKDKYYYFWDGQREAMLSLNSIDDNYICDSGRSVVTYGLGNLTTWRGDKAREIKKELNGMLK